MSSQPGDAALLDRAATQRRVVRTLASAQVFSGLGNGSTLALGSILAVDLGGSDTWAGAVTTCMTLGTALAAMPLSQVALARGRRVALTGGLGLAVLGTFAMVAAVVTRQFGVLLLGSLCVGLAAAVNLQARFAVTDLAEPARRGRELSYVVWAITVGAVLGPNTVRPGAALSDALGLPPLAGPFLISAAGMVVGATIVAVGLRPDPLLLRRELDDGGRRPERLRWSDGLRVVAAHRTAQAALATVVAAHAVMVAVMSMTPLHMQHQAGTLAHHPDTISLIGLTISLHIAGMYGLSPLMGWATDRFGARGVALGGLTALLASVVVTGVFADAMPVVTGGLVLIGLGWSAATVAGSTLLVSALAPADRVPAQGFSDATMSLSGAVAAAAAGPVMGLVDYRGVSAVAGVIAVAAAFAVLALTRPAAPAPAP
ncbi:MFS transporter [Agilicoccus flavus]|uniref:MFS transporter n=1 Tax=Agilicoccus flavus TaxID=2775968 RepID=UPI001CF62837|nr:MFS transporter [Agilicoccus flavus]